VSFSAGSLCPLDLLGAGRIVSGLLGGLIVEISWVRYRCLFSSLLLHNKQLHVQRQWLTPVILTI
jgi:hypothetical protein